MRRWQPRLSCGPGGEVKGHVATFVLMIRTRDAGSEATGDAAVGFVMKLQLLID